MSDNGKPYKQPMHCPNCQYLHNSKDCEKRPVTNPQQPNSDTNEPMTVKDWLIEVFEKGYETGGDIVLDHQFENGVAIYDDYRQRCISEATTQINALRLRDRIDEVANQMENYSFIPEDAGGKTNRQLRLRFLKAQLEQLLQKGEKYHFKEVKDE